jgi:hypothetical protein
MAEIVGIHGILNHLKGEESLAKDWAPALRDGLRRAGIDRAVEVSCVFYGDLFRKSGTKAAAIPKLDAGDVDDEFEQELLLEWWRNAAEVEFGKVSSPDTETKARTPKIVQRALNQLLKSDFFKGWGGERVLIFGLKQVRSYLHDDVIRSAAQERIDKAVGADTRVLVAHSLGSVVTYEWLCANPDNPIKTLVTLGSPLGMASIVFDRLRPSPVSGFGAWPNVDHWYNIADDGDIVAMQKELKTYFGEQIQDRRVHNGSQSHDVLHYLTARETGEAIASGL